MFERTLEAQALDAPSHDLSKFSVALVLHAIVAGALVVASIMIIRPVVGPEPPVGPIQIILPPPPGDPTPVPATPKPPRRGSENPGRTVTPPPVETPPVVPPTATPSELPPQAELPGDQGDGTGLVGRSDGSDDGVGDDGGSGNGDGGGGGPDDAGPVLLTGEMKVPVLVRKVSPVYPNTARLARLQGKVVAQAVIGLDGRVEAVEVLSSTNPIFDEAAVDAVKQWTYRPATMDGRPVRVYFTVVVEFVLR